MEIQEIQDKLNNLISGNLFGLVFDGNIPAAEVLLKVILKRDDIRIESVEGQKELRNPEVGGRKIRLDILAVDGTSHFYNVEVQRRNSGAHTKRARFHSSMVDARMLKEGQEFKDLNEPYVIFITEKGYFGCGLPIYTINRQISPFLNVSVLEGSGTLNGQTVKKAITSSCLRDMVGCNSRKMWS